MNNPKISVIVPVYEVEEYLCECINSILAQTFVDFELILIDDGSLDSSGKICDEFAQKDNRIIVIHQENKGLSCARNTGIKTANGSFITFVDSDDLVANTYLEELYNNIVSYDCDIAICKETSGDKTGVFGRRVHIVFAALEEDVRIFRAIGNKQRVVKIFSQVTL